MRMHLLPVAALGLVAALAGTASAQPKDVVDTAVGQLQDARHAADGRRGG